MKRILLVPIVLLAITGCAQFKELVTVATTTITNPVDAIDIYRAKNVYAASLQLASDWRDYCWSKPYAALMADSIAKPVCENRRRRLRTIQFYRVKASTALGDAQVFVLNHPTLNATDVISAAWEAVGNFKAAIPAK